jgi:2-iminobutanoate/2-iminopropanoate deaminase
MRERRSRIAAKREVVNPPGLPSPGGTYSQVVCAGDLIFLAGMVPRTPDSRKPPAGVRAQTKQCLENLRIALASVNATLADVCTVTAFLSDVERDFAGYNDVYQGFFPESPPARATVQAGLGDILVEIQAIAMRQREGA